jgi:hypothetical protein
VAATVLRVEEAVLVAVAVATCVPVAPPRVVPRRAAHVRACEGAGGRQAAWWDAAGAGRRTHGPGGHRAGGRTAGHRDRPHNATRSPYGACVRWLFEEGGRSALCLSDVDVMAAPGERVAGGGPEHGCGASARTERFPGGQAAWSVHPRSRRRRHHGAAAACARPCFYFFSWCTHMRICGCAHSWRWRPRTLETGRTPSPWARPTGPSWC